MSPDLIPGRLLLAAIALVSASAAAEMPRLAGVVIAPGQQVALFDVGRGVLAQVAEGDDVAGYRVRSIAREGVRLEQDGRVALLRTSPAEAPVTPVDIGGATFGLVLRPQPPPDD